MRVCILANSARYIWNFRVNLMRAIRDAGHDVIVISPAGPEASLIESIGFRHINFPLSPMGTNPFKEIQSIFVLRWLLNKESVDVVLSSTPKGNLYTVIANLFSKRIQIANVSGLGSAYLSRDLISLMVNMLYRITFKKIHHILFENLIDHAEFLSRGLVSSDSSSAIPGLGVDLSHFYPVVYPVEDDVGSLRFLMIARLIGDKGVREYVAAAREIRTIWPHIKFELLGDSAAENPTRISLAEIDEWRVQGDIIHYEHTDDVRPFIARAHCLVLPSYREGMSRTLLEGGAMGRPLIVSDVPGCREAVIVDVNGFLCKAGCSKSLADAMIRFINVDWKKRQEMGSASRQKIASEFGEDLVIKHYLSLLAGIT
jgi:glycosyltransferase involved in cell wall biosynthesis